MEKSYSGTRLVFTDLGVLILLALARIILHTLTNHQYGFHRDELGLLDNARHLDWGYVAYPPVAPFIARVGLAWFGLSLVGVRFFSTVAQAAAMVLAGLMARELGGSRFAQVAAALGVMIAPISLLQGAMTQYVSFDYLWWVLLAYLVIRLLKSQDLRWWLAIGAVIGLGMMTKYTMAFFVAGLVGGVLLTHTRRHLTSPWLWGGVALSLLIFAPNLVWQARHNFISLEFLSSIHARDVAWGRTEGFLPEQFFVASNPFTVPFWVMGLYFYLWKPAGSQYRVLGWMYAIPFVLLLVAQGRSYYLAPAYPMLIAAGVVVWEQWIAAFGTGMRRLARGVTWGALAVGALVFGPVMLPVAPVNSGLWHFTSQLHDNFVEQIGWPDLVETVAGIYHKLPAETQAQTGILTANYGEAGAINLYGDAYDLPQAISGVNSHWLRGYGNPPPETVIVVGFPREEVDSLFAACSVAGEVTNRYGVENEETTANPTIYVCQEPRQPWPELWDRLRSFG